MKNEQKKLEKKALRKEAILDAFEALIKQYGVDKTTMQEVATAVGLSVGTIYNEFTNKEALIDALVDRIERSLHRQISSLKFVSDTPDGRLLELLKAMDGMVDNIIRENRSFADYVLSGTQNFRYLGKKIHQDFGNGLLAAERINSIIQEGIDQGVFQVRDAGQVSVAIRQVFTTYSLTRMFMQDRDDESDRDRWNLCFELMIKGLKVS
jgi:AcrR family transcriptional regulator